ncbi:DinB family protein [Rufibacter sp. LB8]|uniref:DinB family protein n=1 Tax=Rufibacter sp. LB8 TaxID=2777781 RepID=UPI00178C23FC|nr:DinB family protein [Rufibacter sp. LB8]
MYTLPAPGDYNPYFDNYISLVSSQEDIVKYLAEQPQKLQQLLGRVSASAADFAYEPGKWSIKQLLGHMNDTERIMAYRALCIARGEQVSLPGFDENLYVTNARFEDRALESLVTEHQAIRNATLALIKGLPPEATARRGNANGHPITVSALVYIIAGHEQHHLNILKERYLAKL